MKSFLIDIEGTTAPISFVHQTLFPYARERIVSFIESFDLSIHDYTEIKHEFEKDLASRDPSFLKLFPKLNSFSKKELPIYLCYLIDSDRKFGPLKTIQGKIWKQGYEKGEIKSQLFDDVSAFLKKANELGIFCYVYSSGSVEAQKLIYQYSNFGDLTPNFKGYFDTAMGGKKDVQSYLNIAHHLDLEPSEFVFFTDILEEAASAAKSRMDVILLDRPGNTKQPDNQFRTLKDLLSYF